MGDAPDWFEITRRNARSVQTTIGWIFWDPGAIARYAELGLPEDIAGPLGNLNTVQALVVANFDFLSVEDDFCHSYLSCEGIKMSFV